MNDSRIRFFKDINKENVDIAGGKGASLGEMSNARIVVPPGFVILANAFDRFIEESNLQEEISARLKEVNPDDTNSVDRVSAILRDVIHDQPMPRDLEEEILVAFDKLNEEQGEREKPARSGFAVAKSGGEKADFFVAVRSSATAEDSQIASWAGELETYLNTTRENVLERVKKCWSSLFTPRALFYRHEKGLIDSHVSVAVVIQKMVQSEISGIAFTVHPVTEDYDQMIIEAGFGLGEAIVSGQITPDSYIVSKKEMSIMDISVSGQTKKLVKGRCKGEKEKAEVSGDDETGSNEWVPMNESDGGKQKLSGKQIIECAKAFQNIENHYGFPCDIEWAMEGGKLYITQSRPITTLKKVV